MRNITVAELQKSLQALANQKGAKGFDKAKALYLEGVMVVDEQGNPVMTVEEIRQSEEMVK